MPVDFGADTASYSMGTGFLSPGGGGIQRLGRVVNHTTPSSATIPLLSLMSVGVDRKNVLFYLYTVTLHQIEINERRGI